MDDCRPQDWPADGTGAYFPLCAKSPKGPWGAPGRSRVAGRPYLLLSTPCTALARIFPGPTSSGSRLSASTEKLSLGLVRLIGSLNAGKQGGRDTP